MDRFVRTLAVVAVSAFLLAFASLPAAAVDEPTEPPGSSVAPEPTPSDEPSSEPEPTVEPETVTLTGTVVGADGGPIEVRRAYGTQQTPHADGISGLAGWPIAVADDGTFVTELNRWGTADNPSQVWITVYGPLTGTETEGDCTYQLGLVGSWQAMLALAEGENPGPITIVVDQEVRVDSVCESGTPEPTVEPDPTDEPRPTDEPGTTIEPEPTDEPQPTPEPTPSEPLLVVYDGQAVVTVARQPDGSPVQGARVVLTAVDWDGSILQALKGTTDETGTALFEEVARPDEGGRAFDLVATAWAEEVADVEGCRLTYAAEGEVATAAGATVTLEIALPANRDDPLRSECDPPGPDAPVLTGLIVAPDGHGLEIASATFVQSRADGASWGGTFDVAADGTFTFAIQAWGTFDALSVMQLDVRANVATTEFPDGCVETTMDAGTRWLKLALAEGMPLEPVELTLETQPSGVCGVTATPRPDDGSGGTTGDESDDQDQAGAGEGGTRGTLPPTDRTVVAEVAAAPTLLLALMLLIGLTVALLAMTDRDRRRRT